MKIMYYLLGTVLIVTCAEAAQKVAAMILVKVIP